MFIVRSTLVKISFCFDEVAQICYDICGNKEEDNTIIILIQQLNVSMGSMRQNLNEYSYLACILTTSKEDNKTPDRQWTFLGTHQK